MLEPVQGEGGIHPADMDFLRGLRELCNKEELLLIFDEVQCGMGRTGKFFAFQSYGIKPDIVTMAKSLGGGIPIGAMLASIEVAGGFAPGDHASTFGGNPLATAAACKVIDLISDPDFLKQVEESGRYLQECLSQITDERIVGIRGRGLMVGMEFNIDVKELIGLCMEQGLLLLNAGPRVLRFVPPLNISKNEINQGVAILKEALREL